MKIIESVSYDQSDDNGLTFIYFDFGSCHYFTIAYNPNEDSAPYLEHNDQGLSIHSHHFNTTMTTEYIDFDFGSEVQYALGLTFPLRISLQHLSDEDVAGIKEVLRYLKCLFYLKNHN